MTLHRYKHTTGPLNNAFLTLSIVGSTTLADKDMTNTEFREKELLLEANVLL
jgi:hypothetical protein